MIEAMTKVIPPLASAPANMSGIVTALPNVGIAQKPPSAAIPRVHLLLVSMVKHYLVFMDDGS